MTVPSPPSTPPVSCRGRAPSDSDRPAATSRLPPTLRNSFWAGPKVVTATVPVTWSRPAFSIVAASWIWIVPADQVVVPFSRSVWPAAKKSMVSVMVVCEPAVKAVVPASAKSLSPSEDWPLPTVSVPSPRRLPLLAMRNAPVLPSSSKSSDAAVDVGDPGRVARAGRHATGPAGEADRAGAGGAGGRAHQHVAQRQHARALRLEHSRAVGRAGDRVDCCASVPPSTRAQRAVVLELRPTDERARNLGHPPGSVRRSFRPPAKTVHRDRAGDLQQPGVLDRARRPGSGSCRPTRSSCRSAAACGRRRRNRSMSVIVVCEPALNAVMPASEKLLSPSEDWPLPTVSVPSPRRVPSPAMRSAPVVPSSSKSSTPPFTLGDPGRVARARRDATRPAREADRARARGARRRAHQHVAQRQHARPLRLEHSRAVGRARDRVALRQRAAVERRAACRRSRAPTRPTSAPETSRHPPEQRPQELPAAGRRP